MEETRKQISYKWIFLSCFTILIIVMLVGSYTDDISESYNEENRTICDQLSKQYFVNSNECIINHTVNDLMYFYNCDVYISCNIIRREHGII